MTLSSALGLWVQLPNLVISYRLQRISRDIKCWECINCLCHFRLLINIHKGTQAPSQKVTLWVRMTGLLYCSWCQNQNPFHCCLCSRTFKWLIWDILICSAITFSAWRAFLSHVLPQISGPLCRLVYFLYSVDINANCPSHQLKLKCRT